MKTYVAPQRKLEFYKKWTENYSKFLSRIRTKILFHHSNVQFNFVSREKRIKKVMSTTEKSKLYRKTKIFPQNNKNKY